MSDACLPLYDITPFTMLDFPDHTACIVWVAGCNMRCAYCHNPEIVRAGPGQKTPEEIFAFLEKRKGLLDGVVLSGGEATLYPEIVLFARHIKQMGYKVKLDTNGTRPKIVRQLLEEQLVDYIALDYKAPPEKFQIVTGTNRPLPFRDTLTLLCEQRQIPFEVRTTIHTDLLDEQDVAAIIADLDSLKYHGTYYVQNYRDNDGHTLGCLATPKRAFNPALLPAPKNFTVQWRNFSHTPANAEPSENIA